MIAADDEDDVVVDFLRRDRFLLLCPALFDVIVGSELASTAFLLLFLVDGLHDKGLGPLAFLDSVRPLP
jgi:hypothetical protein